MTDRVQQLRGQEQAFRARYPHLIEGTLQQETAGRYAGKFTVLICCTQPGCPAQRCVATSDLFQVSRCPDCTRAARNAARRAARAAQAAATPPRAAAAPPRAAQTEAGALPPQRAGGRFKLGGARPAAVTTVSVTSAVGIVQSAFYRHFSNMEECVAAAAERVTGQLREAVDDARRRMYESGPGLGEDLVRHYRELFEIVSEQRVIAQLLLRYRSDPLALNGVFYRFARNLSADLAQQLAKQASKAGRRKLPTSWMEALADHSVAASLAAIEAYLEGRGLNVEEAAPPHIGTRHVANENAAMTQTRMY